MGSYQLKLLLKQRHRECIYIRCHHSLIRKAASFAKMSRSLAACLQIDVCVKQLIEQRNLR